MARPGRQGRDHAGIAPVRILDIRERAVPVQSSMRNAAFDFSEMTTSVVAVITDRPGVVGYAFNSTGRYACGAAMRERFIPRLLAAPPDGLLGEDGLIEPTKAVACMTAREKPGGDAERSIPVGTIETAIWDALAKAQDRPLWHVLAERFNGGAVPAAVPCYVGGGWYRPGEGVAELADEMRRHLDAGYTSVKIKAGGAPLEQDCRRIEAAIGVLGDASRLAIDANAAMPPDRAITYADRLAPYKLRWFEEPVAPLAYAAFAELAGRYAPPLATGENLFCLPEVENLLRFGGFRPDRDVLQVDPPQAYGIACYAEMVGRVEAMGGSRARIFPHGGNMMSFAVAAGLGLGGCEAYPGVFGAFGGFIDGMVVRDGALNLPDAPGIGFERQPALFALMRELAA